MAGCECCTSLTGRNSCAFVYICTLCVSCSVRSSVCMCVAVWRCVPLLSVVVVVVVGCSGALLPKGAGCYCCERMHLAAQWQATLTSAAPRVAPSVHQCSTLLGALLAIAGEVAAAHCTSAVHCCTARLLLRCCSCTADLRCCCCCCQSLSLDVALGCCLQTGDVSHARA